MKDRWLDLSGRRNWDSEGSLLCWGELSELYQSEDRFYHSLTHIEDCLNQFQNCEWRDCIETELAIWFHDVIYDGHRHDNESVSGQWAENWLGRLGENGEFCDRVGRLIQVTDHQTEPEDEKESTLIDIDLSILGRPKNVYLDYANQIRREYSFVPDDDYRQGRSDILKRFLERDRIYRTEEFFNRYEQGARSNLEAEIDILATAAK